MRIFTAAIAIVLVSALTACDPAGSDPSPEPVATVSGPSESPTPTEAEDAAPHAARILLKTESFFVLDEDGEVMNEFDYFEPAAPVIAQLSDVFGGEPIATPFAGYDEQTDGTFYTWDGFTLKDWNGPAVAYWEDFDVIASSAMVRGITIVGAGDIGVGATIAQATEAGGSYVDTVFDEPVAAYFELDSMLAPDPEWADWYDGPRRFVLAELSGGVILSLTAPDVNYGP